MNYDPNLVSSGQMAKQTVRLTFGVWDYRLTDEFVVGGNCLGLAIIRSAVMSAYDKYGGSLTMQKIGDVAETMIVEDEEDRSEDWLEDNLISAEIISIEADAEATKRWRAA